MMCITLPSLSKDILGPYLKLFLVESYLSKKRRAQSDFKKYLALRGDNYLLSTIKIQSKYESLVYPIQTMEKQLGV